jgi:hypothetical protein
MDELEALIGALTKAGVDFIIVGGIAATVHGAARPTYDLDVVYERSPENLDRLVKALEPHRPYLRGAPPDLPFRWDRKTLERGLNFTLTTDLGDVDLLGEITEMQTYETLLPATIDIELFGRRCRCLTLQRLIEVKRATGRRKDFDAIAELEAILEEDVNGR